MTSMPCISLDEEFIEPGSYVSLPSLLWEGPNTLTLAFQNLLNENLLTDVQFCVQGQDIRAHRLVVALWSPVLADRFFGPVQSEEPLVIDDVSPAIFSALIKFLYGSKMSVYQMKKDIEFVLGMYKAAMKFEIELLKEISLETLLTTTPNKHNTFQLLEAAKLIGSETLEQRCIRVLETHTSQVLSTYDLVNVTSDMLRTVLQLSHVSFCSEYEVILWVLAWAKNQFVAKTNTRSFKTILEDVLPYIAFTALKPEELGTLVQKHPDLFTEQEGFRIFMNIVLPGSRDLPEWCVARTDRTYSYDLQTSLS